MNKLTISSKAPQLFVRYKNSLNRFSKVGKLKSITTHNDLIKKSNTSFIQKIKYLIEENIEDENFGILALGKAIGLSRAQLHNRIKADTGMSTSIYIRNIRLENAKILLQNPDLNVSEVAYRVGFKCPRYFSTLFLKKISDAPFGDEGTVTPKGVIKGRKPTIKVSESLPASP